MIFNDPIETLHGIGEKKKLLYEKIGIYTKWDLLSYFPISYEDRRKITFIDRLKEDEFALVKGKVTYIGNQYMKGFTKNIKIAIEDKSGVLDVFFFSAKYLKNILIKGKEYFFYGKVSKYKDRMQMIHPELIDVNKYEASILPVYKTVKGISQNEMRRYIKCLLDEEIREYLPQNLVKENGLCPIDFAIKNIHFPQDKGHLKIAKYRMIYEDLFIMQLGFEKVRSKKNIGKKMDCEYEEFEKSFNFSFTSAQKRALADIAQNMKSGKVMNRLLQGDVGSGKTAVATAAMYIAIKSGYQASFMVPTEVLAKQHFENLQKHFEMFDIKAVLLTGSTKNSEKKEIYQEIERGTAKAIIGTHALIQKNVNFNKLGLVITDEQHRFGVSQRARLANKGISPHILAMTATPIPRTLAIVIYGEQDVSTIDSLPEGRKSIETFHLKEKDRKIIYENLLNEVKNGRQGYVVVPLIEESENMENIRSVENIYTELKDVYKGCNVRMDVIHSGIKQEKKDALMREFYDGKIDVLIATVVIEVGINVPNATVMVIENAERFGLAQLHQLRGRIGRGSHKSYCYLINGGKSHIANQRMDIMTKSKDGFYISEKDFELRGPGEVFGTRQHGIPDVILMNAVKHIDILQIAKKDAQKHIDVRNDVIEKKINCLFGEDSTMSL